MQTPSAAAALAGDASRGLRGNASVAIVNGSASFADLRLVSPPAGVGALVFSVSGAAQAAFGNVTLPVQVLTAPSVRSLVAYQLVAACGAQVPCPKCEPPCVHGAAPLTQLQPLEVRLGDGGRNVVAATNESHVVTVALQPLPGYGALCANTTAARLRAALSAAGLEPGRVEAALALWAPQQRMFEPPTLTGTALTRNMTDADGGRVVFANLSLTSPCAALPHTLIVSAPGLLEAKVQLKVSYIEDHLLIMGCLTRFS
jgi:hypothetical protein